MPGMDNGFLAAFPALLLAAAAVLLGVPAMDSALRRGDGERLFWIGLTGVLTAVAAVAWAGVSGPGAAAVTGLAVMAGSAAGGLWLRRRHVRRLAARRRKLRKTRIQALAQRRQAVLLDWSSYELDPWKGSEYPGISDVREVETSRLARAAAAAEAAQAAAESEPGNDEAVQLCASAVDQLEEAWEEARAAARRRAG